MQRVFAILLGAGAGSRLKAGVAKAFVSIDGITILERSYRALIDAWAYARCIVTVPSGLEDDPVCRMIVKNEGIVITGGAERKDSVARALRELQQRENPSATDIVLIHDAARCFVTADIIVRAIEACRVDHAVTVGVPSTDSLKEVGQDSMVVRSLPRSSIWCVQTPQVFRHDLITRAHADIRSSATDDASLVEPIHPVKMVMGDILNRKITFAGDL